VYSGPVRKRLRFAGHDYHAPCSVHVTICTYAHQKLFGEVVPAGMQLNDAGRFTESTLLSLHSDSEGIAIDTYIVMPDHIHAIIMLGTNPQVITTTSISDLVQRFKMTVMRSWPTGVRRGGWPTYDTHLWQRSFYDTLIRHDLHLEQTREYILANPYRWMERYSG
jgi:putative transposase